MYEPRQLYDRIVNIRRHDGVSVTVAIDRVFRELDGHGDEVMRDAGRWMLARIEQVFRQGRSEKPIIAPSGHLSSDRQSALAGGDDGYERRRHRSPDIQAGPAPYGSNGGHRQYVDQERVAAVAPSSPWHDRIPWLDAEVSIFGNRGRKRLRDATIQDFRAGANQRERTAATFQEQASILRRIEHEMQSHADKDFGAFAARAGEKVTRRLISKVEPKLLPGSTQSATSRRL